MSKQKAQKKANEIFGYILALVIFSSVLNAVITDKSVYHSASLGPHSLPLIGGVTYMCIDETLYINHKRQGVALSHNPITNTPYYCLEYRALKEKHVFATSYILSIVVFWKYRDYLSFLKIYAKMEDIGKAIDELERNDIASRK